MLSCKKISMLMFALVVALSSCMEQKILFTFKNDVNRNFFKEIPGLGTVTYNGHPVIQKANNVEVYISSFSEKFIEKDHLLEYTELNDSTKTPFVSYWKVDGYSQDLYLLKYEFIYSTTNKETGKSFDFPTQAAVFFSVKHNGSGNTLGITPCYFGIINEEDNLIAFDTELSLKKDKDHFYLKLIKKSKKMNGLMFIPADFPLTPKTPEDKFNIEKIVRVDPNKVGGYKPLVFDMSNIFHDSNALQFHYYSTITLTR
jgi:hypothetical protein